jgi:hypothetical protein
VGAESALADGVSVDTAADGAVGDTAARWETNAAGAAGAAECPVRCYCQRCQPRRGDASAGTGMPFQTLDESPCARVAGDASACSMGRWVKIWNMAQELGRKERIVQGQGYYRGRGEDHGREPRGGSRVPWRMAGKARGRCATGGSNES